MHTITTIQYSLALSSTHSLIAVIIAIMHIVIIVIATIFKMLRL